MESEAMTDLLLQQSRANEYGDGPNIMDVVAGSRLP